MQHMQVFTYEDSMVRAAHMHGEPWWVLKDVCKALQLSNSRMVADRLDEDENRRHD